MTFPLDERHKAAMKMMIRWTMRAEALVILMAVVGCGGTYDASIEGAVTLDGQPVPRGLVAFHPVTPGPAAYAFIEDGAYVVRTGREVGLPSGDYQVTVSANEPPAVAQTATGGPPPPGKSITPPWYLMKETSGLQYSVEPGANEINIELTSQPPAAWKQRAG